MKKNFFRLQYWRYVSEKNSIIILTSKSIELFEVFGNKDFFMAKKSSFFAKKNKIIFITEM